MGKVDEIKFWQGTQEQYDEQNVEQEHPDYICYINNVGIKIADKFIAIKRG